MFWASFVLSIIFGFNFVFKSIRDTHTTTLEIEFKQESSNKHDENIFGVDTNHSFTPCIHTKKKPNHCI